jgi:hypothetical protein
MDKEIERIPRKRVYPPSPTPRQSLTRRLNHLFEAGAIVAAFVICVWAVLQ